MGISTNISINISVDSPTNIPIEIPKIPNLSILPIAISTRLSTQLPGDARATQSS
jgi:hypothetical protein